MRSSNASTNSAGRAAITALAPSFSPAPSMAANRVAYCAATSGVRTIPAAGLSEIALAKRSFAAGTASNVATACAPALSPKIVTLSGSPPNTAMFSRTQRRAITKSRRYRLSSIVTSEFDSDDRSRHPSAPRR